MFYKRFVMVATAIFFLPGIGLGQDERMVLDLALINKSVYEVIIPKPLDGALTYEKPLPMDLLPFAIRNDKYYSIGTAFSINESEFITAAHVMNLGFRKQMNEIFLRDINGKVFPLDQVIKFSSRQDFVIFTIKGRVSPEHLDLNPDSKINEKVYAVGNALGQGIIIRDGLYTSNTPEEVDGKWNWIRFSAAASPGNSGGPLLDVNGKVIGIILRKSESENLNMALPIREAQKDNDHDAEIYDKVIYRIDIFDEVKSGTLDKKIKLPMGYKDFSDQLIKIEIEFWKQLLNDLISENKNSIFPNGDGSKKLLYKNFTTNMPQLITKQADGTWEASSLQKMNHSDLGDKGEISFGPIKNTLFLKIQKPDNIPLSDFYSDSKLFMDLILKSVSLPRMVGPEKVRITSLGKADNEYTHLDSYGRKWMVKSWPIPFGDMEVVTFSLPVPGGCVTMMKMGQTGQTLDMYAPDLKILTEFIYLSFSGTLKQWREYLALKEKTPLLFKDIDLRFNADNFEFKSKRVKFSLKPESLKFDEQSRLIMGLGYYKDHQSFVWNITSIALVEDKFKSDNQIVITRNLKPVDDLDEKYSDHWKNLLERRKPYDMKVHVINDRTEIGTVYPDLSTNKQGSASSVLYDILKIKTGTVEQSGMESGIKTILENLTLNENE